MPMQLGGRWSTRKLAHAIAQLMLLLMCKVLSREEYDSTLGYEVGQVGYEFV